MSTSSPSKSSSYSSSAGVPTTMQQHRHNRELPTTPPLSPRKDNNFVSPSPLHIRNEMPEQQQQVSDIRIARGDKENVLLVHPSVANTKGVDKDMGMGQRSKGSMARYGFPLLLLVELGLIG